ncbi:hypothetical protein OAK85_03745 [Mariniblastus sp.]|nr:hypothetical protein [Mariniblastus sp.]
MIESNYEPSVKTAGISFLVSQEKRNCWNDLNSSFVLQTIDNSVDSIENDESHYGSDFTATRGLA